jgi:hypothetical protein
MTETDHRNAGHAARTAYLAFVSNATANNPPIDKCAEKK